MDTRGQLAFTAGTLVREAANRRNPELLAAALSSPDARVTPLWRSRNLFENRDGMAGESLAWLPADHPFLAEAREPPLFLGRNGADWLFAVDVSARDDLDAHAAHNPDQVHAAEAGAFRHHSLPGNCAFRDLRSVMGILGAGDAESAAVARALASWHRSHRFCAACGKPSRPVQAGWQRDCPDCGRSHFPRTDPVVIMLITAGNDLLLGRSHAWPDRMYSLLAGFMEPGETVEHAARREALEEAGVRIGRVRYLASQPWPFPASLMIGCRADAESRELTVDPVELEDARWIGRELLARAIHTGDCDFKPPRQGSIARRLVLDWLAGRC